MILTDNINDFADKVIEFVNNESLYKKLNIDISNSNKSDYEKIAAFEV